MIRMTKLMDKVTHKSKIRKETMIHIDNHHRDMVELKQNKV